MTPGFVPQVMGPLVRAGWWLRPGPTGGYFLTADLDELSVLQVIEEIDGPTESGRCVVAGGLHRGGQPYSLHFAWRRRNELVIAGIDDVAAAGATHDHRPICRCGTGGLRPVLPSACGRPARRPRQTAMALAAVVATGAGGLVPT